MQQEAGAALPTSLPPEQQTGLTPASESHGGQQSISPPVLCPWADGHPAPAATAAVPPLRFAGESRFPEAGGVLKAAPSASRKQPARGAGDTEVC